MSMHNIRKTLQLTPKQSRWINSTIDKRKLAATLNIINIIWTLVLASCLSILSQIQPTNLGYLKKKKEKTTSCVFFLLARKTIHLYRQQ